MRGRSLLAISPAEDLGDLVELSEPGLAIPELADHPAPPVILRGPFRAARRYYDDLGTWVVIVTVVVLIAVLTVLDSLPR